MKEIIAQSFGIVAMIFIVFSFQQRKRNMAILLQLIGGALFCVNYTMLGAIVGGLLNFIAVIRGLVFLNKEKLKADSPIWLIIFISLFLTSYVLSFCVFDKAPTTKNFIFEILPVIGMIASTLSFRKDDAKSIRRYGFISSPCWLTYNIVNFSIGAIITEVLNLISIVIGTIRFDIKKKKDLN
ncbi:MAG: YgjV family protein [Clostridia bacterium]|nr:YgjV family protein [Clostridia bacterium]